MMTVMQCQSERVIAEHAKQRLRRNRTLTPARIPREARAPDTGKRYREELTQP
jgi:hypothetical protein